MSQPLPIRDNLRILISRSGLSKAEICRRANLNGGVLKDILSGKTNSPTVATLEKIGTAIGVEVTDFMRGPSDLEKRTITPLQIRGECKAGSWQRQLFWHEANWKEEIFPNDPRFPGLDRFAMKISDSSMSTRYEEGDLIACVLLSELEEIPEAGRRYIASRENDKGELEVVARELYIDDENNQWLLAKPEGKETFAPIAITDRTVIHARITGHWRRDS